MLRMMEGRRDARLKTLNPCSGSNETNNNKGKEREREENGKYPLQ